MGNKKDHLSANQSLSIRASSNITNFNLEKVNICILLGAELVVGATVRHVPGSRQGTYTNKLLYELTAGQRS
jgi:hypothetical protein